MEFKMLKKLLVVPMLTLSTVANAGLFSGTLNVNPLLENLDVSGVTFDDINFNPINSLNTALSLFPDQLNFDIDITDHYNSQALNHNASFSTLTPTMSTDNRWIRLIFGENRFYGSFINYGYECLQGTGIQVNGIEGYWQGSEELESGCYKTVNSFDFTLENLSISSSDSGNNIGTPVQFNELHELNENVAFNATAADIRIEKRFYDTRVGTGGDIDDIFFDYAGVLLLEQEITSGMSLNYITDTAQVSTPATITSVPETSALALLALGLCGFGFTRKVKQQ